MSKTLLPWMAVAVLGLLGFLGARYLSMPDGVVRIGESACELSAGPCRHRLPDGSELVLMLRPRPVPLMQPVTVEVTIDGEGWRPLQGEITGLNMRMAPSRVSLHASGDGHWSGETILPVCSQRRMHWQFALLIQGQGKRWRILDDFHTRR